MAACHLVAYGNLTLLGNINAHGLVHAWGQLIPIFPGKYLSVHHNAILSMRHLQRGVTDFPGLLAKNSPQKAFLCRQLCLTLGGYLPHQDIPGADFRPDADNPSLIQIF